ncbi:MAG: hypothetical protein ACI8SR_000102 [Oceanicoccus sp.]|jgi:hypothetical protein
MNQHKTQLIINIILFQCTWFSLVTGPLLFGIVFLLCLLIHTSCTSRNVILDSVFYLLVLLFGVIADSLLMHLGVYQFGLGLDAWSNQALIPVWLICLWLAFALTLKRSLNWLFSYPWLMLILLAVLGPLSYYAGSQLNPLRFQIKGDMLFLILQWVVMSGVILGLNQVLVSNKKGS